MRKIIPQPQPILEEIFRSALAAVDPGNAVLQALAIEGATLQAGGRKYELDCCERVVVVGAGKAAAKMAQAIESLLGNRIAAGLIVVKEGHTAPLSIVQQFEAAHPVPNEAGAIATRKILQLVRSADEKTLLICLLSGGASALLVSPVEAITLEDKQQATRLLLDCGASIAELNCVRKHLSSVKGGNLARASYPAQLLSLIVSDVIGDPFDVIASGPTTFDNSTFRDAWQVLLKYALQEKIPPRILAYLQKGLAGEVSETVKENDPCLKNAHNVIVAGIGHALLGAKAQAGKQGFAAKIIADAVQGEAREAARWLAQVALAELAAMQSGERRCLLSGGETTVSVRGDGKGGRNQEFALAFALEMDGVEGVSLLSAGTDGSDGQTDAAGAMVDGKTLPLARSQGIDAPGFLRRNDSYAFFNSLDALAGAHSHFKSGPTGTNVMDMQIVLLQK